MLIRIIVATLHSHYAIDLQVLGTCAIGNLGKERAGSLNGLVAGWFPLISVHFCLFLFISVS